MARVYTKIGDIFSVKIDETSNMKKYILILGLFIFLSCGETATDYKESNYTFQMIEEGLFVKTSKRPGAKFVVFFAQDSLSLDTSKDSIEFKTGEDHILMVVDSTNIYLQAFYLLNVENIENNELKYNMKVILPPIESIGNNKFNIKIIPDSIFKQFYENGKLKYPYIHIYPRTYSITVNDQDIKEGDLYGGW